MKTAKNSKAPVHIMLETPIQLRKDVLSTAIDATRLLKEFEEFLVLKNKKMKTLKYLQKEMREIKQFSKEFNEDHFPVIPHHEPVHREHHTALKEHVVKAIQKQALPKPAPKKPATEVDRLNKELQDIEAKLGTL